MMPYGWNDGGWGIMWMILSLAVMVVLVLVLIRAFSAGDGRREPSRDPTDVLAIRFANGEIDSDEFRERLDVLQGDAAQKSKR
jgi:putative membrane protein